MGNPFTETLLQHQKGYIIPDRWPFSQKTRSSLPFPGKALRLLSPNLPSPNSEKMLKTLSDLLCNKNIPKDYMSDEKARGAYRSYYHEQSFQKALSLVQEILLIPSVSNFFNRHSSIQIADLATGTGGFAQGIVHGLSSYSFSSFKVTLQDRSRPALDAAAAEFSAVFSHLNLSLETRNGTLPKYFPPLSDVQILSWGNMLTEWDLTRDTTKKLLGHIDQVLVPGGLLIIAEPADRISSRKLHQFSNDLLVGLPGFMILGPCPNNRKGNCPALENENDWCHEDRPHQFSSELIHLSKRLGHIKDSLKMSYLICQKTEVPAAPHPEPLETEYSTMWKMISEMTHERGLSKSTFCDGIEWNTYRLLKRHKAPENSSFFHLKKGQVVKMKFSADPEKKGDVLDIPKGTVVFFQAPP